MPDATGLPSSRATELALRAAAARAAANLRILRTIAADLGYPLPGVVDDAIVALRAWSVARSDRPPPPTSRAGRQAPGR
jgi:hypothetical protein